MSLRRIGALGWLGVALVVAIALLTAFGVLSLATSGGYYGLMGTGSWGWAVAMMAIPGLVLVAVLLVVLRDLGRPAVPSGTDALDVLDGRYARGELRREDYLKMRADLTGRSSSP